ncbi:cation:dicarboxylate symporter family transporter [Erythrobacter sp. JK5]|uniref:cation:dicarboxylate symporter family transporter n=1 Tax=Erythrobacter sp. JK5 TaxID=2829500 RepID=UPI00353037CF
MTEQADTAPTSRFELITIRLPVVATFAALIVGLGLGVAASGAALPDWLRDAIAVVGTLWLRALQMTIIPLVAALLVLGLAQMAQAARAGAAARRFLALLFGVLIAGGCSPPSCCRWC